MTIVVLYFLKENLCCFWWCLWKKW